MFHSVIILFIMTVSNTHLSKTTLTMLAGSRLLFYCCISSQMSSCLMTTCLFDSGVFILLLSLWTVRKDSQTEGKVSWLVPCRTHSVTWWYGQQDHECQVHCVSLSVSLSVTQPPLSPFLPLALRLHLLTAIMFIACNL